MTWDAFKSSPGDIALAAAIIALLALVNVRGVKDAVTVNLVLAPGQAGFLGKIYAFGAMLSFAMAHLSLIRLRMIAPDQRRSYRSPGRLPWRGHDLPPLAVVGLAGTALSFVVVNVLDLTVAIAGITWMALGMTGYVLYRRRQELDLVTAHQVAVPQPVTDTEAEYESVLVALDVHHYRPQTIATAAKLASTRRRGSTCSCSSRSRRPTRSRRRYPRTRSRPRCRSSRRPSSRAAGA